MSLRKFCKYSAIITYSLEVTNIGKLFFDNKVPIDEFIPQKYSRKSIKMLCKAPRTFSPHDMNSENIQIISDFNQTLKYRWHLKEETRIGMVIQLGTEWIK